MCGFGKSSETNVFHPDIVCPPGRSPGVQVEITNISFNFSLYGFPNTQTVFVGSKQSFAYKTQSGTSYGSMTGCKVNFKVIQKFSKCICQLNDAEDEFLSLPGRVLPNIWCGSSPGGLQGQKGRLPQHWKEKVWNSFSSIKDKSSVGVVFQELREYQRCKKQQAWQAWQAHLCYFSLLNLY